MLTNYFSENKYDQAMATPLIFKSVLSRGRVVQSTKIGEGGTKFNGHIPGRKRNNKW